MREAVSAMKRAVAIALVISIFQPVLAANAAEFQIVDQQQDTDTTPPTGPPCATAAAAATNVTDGMTAALAQTASASAAAGQVVECDDEARASASASAVFELVATGEDPSERVRACATVVLATATALQTAGEATAFAGGASFGLSPAVIVRLPGGTTVRFGPFTAEGGGGASAAACERDLVLGFGDRLEVETGTLAIARLAGIGNASASAASQIEIELAPCEGAFPSCPNPSEVSTPVLSAPSLACLALLLGAAGVRRIRRRQA